ncbi:O-antigen ligase family protein [Dietzia maris]
MKRHNWAAALLVLASYLLLQTSFSSLIANPLLIFGILGLTAGSLLLSPIMTLTFGLVAMLGTSSEFSWQYAGILWVASGSVGMVLYALASGSVRRIDDRAPVGILTLIGLSVPAALFLRTVISDDPGSSVFYALALAGAVAIVLTRSHLLFIHALAVAGSTFILASALMGTSNLTGSRWEGVSGNPNGMTAGVLLVLPFVFTAMRRAKLRASAISFAVVILVALWLLVQSGSDQAIVGIGVIVLGYGVRLVLGRAPSMAAVVSATSFLLAVGILVVAAVADSVDEDVRSLSGRVPLYLASIGPIWENPLFGTGGVHFEVLGEGVRSSHSTLLSIGVLAGIAVMAVATVFLAGVAYSSLKLFAVRGHDYALVGLIIVVIQAVQSMGARPLFWAILIFLSTLPVRDLLDHSRSRATSAMLRVERHSLVVEESK